MPWIPIPGSGGGGSSGNAYAAELRLTGNQAITSSTWTAIDWDDEEYDDNSFWTSSAATRITFTDAGRYLVIVSTHIAADSNGNRYLRAVLNGDQADELFEASTPPVGAINDRLHLVGIVDAAASDYIEIEIYQDSGGNLNLLGTGSVGDHAETTRVFIAQQVGGTNTAPSLVQTAENLTTRAHTTDNTWEDITGATITFSPNAAGKHRVVFTCHWRPASTNWLYHQVRLLLDGATTNVTPTAFWLTQRDANAAGDSNQMTSFAEFEVDFPDTSSQTVKIQTHDGGSSLNRTFEVTRLSVWGP